MSQLRTPFSEFIYEAIVEKVDYENGTCTLSPLSFGLEDMIPDVPLPYHAGSGNAGIFHGLERGSRVIAADTSGSGPEYTVIVGTIPSKRRIGDNFRGAGRMKNIPGGTLPYPKMQNGRIVIRGGRGNGVSMFETGDIHVSTISNHGSFFKGNRLKMAHYLVAEDQTIYSNSGKGISGAVLRTTAVQSNVFPTKDVGEAPIRSDVEYHKRAVELGFFSGTKVFRRNYGRKKRNMALAEHRTVITEFSVDSNFSGFDFESKKNSGLAGPYSATGLDSKFFERGNTLDISPGELIEIIGGNVVSVTGKILDLNYNQLSYGRPGNKIPLALTAKKIENAKRISRRGIGYHFQLSTASSSTESNSFGSNFVFDIDKEGVLKVNVPRSSSTGNYPFASKASFGGGFPTVSYALPSEEEPIPVMLRDDLGEIVLPNALSQGIESRSTGIRFSNTDDNPYFPSGTDDGSIKQIVRINPTKYHNMYSAAERLIANTVDLVNIPALFVDDNGLPGGNASGKPFEILYPEAFYEEDEDQSVGTLLGGSDDPFPIFMSVVAVAPATSAIYTGGDVLVSGVYYDKKITPCSNSFKLEQEGTGFSATTTDASGKELISVGGVSANLNFGGAIYSSIGRDDVDGKSLMMDTEGSVISWFGADKAGRSMVTQTDGDVLLNIGGSYSGSGPNPEDKVMNIGRFELRVNITDKQFVNSEFNSEDSDNTESGSNPLGASDIMISLSENGIVIAGMKPGLPMVIRNQDKILIESAGSDVILKGQDVKMVDASGRMKTLKSEGR